MFKNSIHTITEIQKSKSFSCEIFTKITKEIIRYTFSFFDPMTMTWYILEKKSDKHVEPDPPFEWVEFKRPDGTYLMIYNTFVWATNIDILGEIVKGTVLPPLHRDEDVTISRNVPIVNLLLEDAINDDKPVASANKTYEDVEPKSIKPTTATTKSCDAGTQTEKSDKKSGCAIMWLKINDYNVDNIDLEFHLVFTYS